MSISNIDNTCIVNPPPIVTAKEDNPRKGGCGFCKCEFDLFCSKSKRFMSFDEFWNIPPFRPSWCEGQEYTPEFHS